MHTPDCVSDDQDKSPALNHRLVTDDVTRMVHWLFSLSFIGAYISADSDSLLTLHMGLGYLMLILLGFRILWGLVGPRRARLVSMWQRIRNISPWIDAQKANNDGLRRHSQNNWQTPQNALLALSVVMLLLTTMPLVLSGYMTEISAADGLFEKLHELFGEFYLLLVIAHVVAIVIVSLWRQRNLARPMVTGYLASKGPDLIKHRHTWVALVLCAGALGWVFYFVTR